MQGAALPDKLIIVRHGKTNATEEGRYCGRTDMSLSAAGTEQAKRLRKWIKKCPLHCIYTSPLNRCKETASIIKEKRKIPTIILPELQEVDFGRWEGLTLAEMQNRYPREFRSWRENFSEFQLPGGEKVIDMIRRIKKFWKEVIGKYPQKSVLVVTHGGPAKVMVMTALGLPMKNFWHLHIDTGSVSVIEFMDNIPLARYINVVP